MMNASARAWFGVGGSMWMVATLLGACGHAVVSESPPQAAPKPEASSGSAAPGAQGTKAQAAEPDRAQHMEATFWMAVRARDAVVAGDLLGAQRAGLALEQHDYAGVFPESWNYWVKQMQKEAGNLSVAGSLPEAAQSVARLGLSCGDCHFQQKQGPDKQREQPLPWRDGPDTLDARMGRHEIGAEQLWSGLIVPSENDWHVGTVTLTRAPLSRPREDGEPIDPALAVRVEQVRDIAKRARVAPSHAERAKVYGDLIASCGACHVQADVEVR